MIISWTIVVGWIFWNCRRKVWTNKHFSCHRDTVVISQPTSTYVWKPQKTRIIQRKRRLQSHFSDRLQHSVYFTRRIRKRKGGGKFLLMFFLHHSTYNSDFHSITPSLTTTNTFAQYEQRNMLNLSVTTPINLWPLLCYRRVTGNEYVKEAFQLSNAS